MKKILILILLTVSTNVFSGVYFNAEKLITYIKSSSATDNMVALGYIYGVVDTHTPICGWKMAGVTGNQLVQVTKNYLEKHPESWNYGAYGVVIYAIKEVYPCKK